MNDNKNGCPNAAPLPQVTFSAFVISLASSVLVALGEVPDPATGQFSKDQLLAKHNIDILEMLKEKTRAGLEPDESSLLDSLLCELKFKYVILCDNAKNKA